MDLSLIITLGAIFLITLIGAYLRSIVRDRCLKSFVGFNVTLELVRRGYTEAQIARLWSGNLLRVMADVEKVARQIQGGHN